MNVKGFDSVENIFAVISADEVEQRSDVDDRKSTFIFAHCLEPSPLVCRNVVDLRITDSFFAFLSSEQVQLLVNGNGSEFGTIGAERAYFFPLPRE